MIKGIKVSNLRNSEFLQLFTHIHAIIRQNGPAALQVTDMYDTLGALITEADGMLNARRGHVLSKQLEALDARREAALIGMQRIIEGFSYSPRVAERDAAQLLQTHIASFGGNIARNNYQSQTKLVSKLVSELSEEAKLQIAVTALGLTPWVAELETANQLFDTDFMSRTEDWSTVNAQSVTLKRMAIAELWSRLRTRLNSHYDISNGGSPWGETVSFINSMLDNYNNLLARRQRGEVEDAVMDEEDTVNAG